MHTSTDRAGKNGAGDGRNMRRRLPHGGGAGAAWRDPLCHWSRCGPWADSRAATPGPAGRVSSLVEEVGWTVFALPGLLARRWALVAGLRRRPAVPLSLVAFALTWLAWMPPAARAQGLSPERLAVDRFIESQMDRHRIPGVALVVVEDGRVTYATGYGTAGGGRPMTAGTPMSIGSITKSFTAVAILQLVEEGRIDLDAPVRTYLPWFRVADDAASDSITVRHLLQHRSGLSEFGYNRVHPPDTTLEQGVRDLRDARLTAPVGTTYQYFSPNYQALALIIETVTGQTYGAYVAEHIFAPLRMTRSYASQVEAQAAGMAQGHSKLFGYPLARDHPFRQYVLGAGYLVSTARDLSHLLVALGNDGVFEGVRILAPASVALMRLPVDEQGDTTTGLAWGSRRYHGATWEGASGADETFMSQMLLAPRMAAGTSG